MRLLAALLVSALARRLRRRARCGGAQEGRRRARGARRCPRALLTLQELHRRGSQNDVKAPAGETRRVMYFDADLKLAKDYDFGAWDSPGVAGVISALGTGPRRASSGITSGGNKAGDVIRAHGTAIYKRDGDKWVPAVAPRASAPLRRPSFAAGGAQRTPEKLLEAMRTAIATAPPDTSAATREVIAQELEAAHAAIRARLARVAAGYAHRRRTRQRAVPALRRRRSRRRRRARSRSSPRAATKTCACFAKAGWRSRLAQADSALLALEGKGPFAEEGPYPTLRAIGACIPSPCT